MDYVKIILYNPKKNNFELIYSKGWKIPNNFDINQFAMMDTQFRYTIQTREVIIVNNYTKDKRFSVTDMNKLHNIKSGASVLIYEKGEPMGVLSFHSRKVRNFKQGEIKYIENVANLLALVILNNRLLNKIQFEKDKFQQIVDNSPYLIITIKPKTFTIKSINKIALQCLGYEEDSENLISSNFINLIHPRSKETFYQEVYSKMQQNLEASFTFLSLLRKDGTELPIDMSYNFIYSSDKKLENIMIYAIDVSKERNLQAQITSFTEKVDRMTLKLLTIEGIGKLTNTTRSEEEFLHDIGQLFIDLGFVKVISILEKLNGTTLLFEIDTDQKASKNYISHSFLMNKTKFNNTILDKISRLGEQQYFTQRKEIEELRIIIQQITKRKISIGENNILIVMPINIQNTFIGINILVTKRSK